MSLTEKAMLVDLNVSVFSGRRHDKAITAEVAETHGAAADAGRYNKLLVAKDAIAIPEKAAGALRIEHYKFTLPWADSGPRILPVAAYFDYTNALQAKREAFDAAVDQFVEQWPNLVQDARRRLNGMFREEDYPSAENIRRRFGVNISVFPLPDASDFRVTLTETELKRIRQDIELTVTDRMENAVRDAWERAHSAVGRMVERLGAYTVSEEGKVSHPFRDTMVSNIRELAELLPKLNVTGDAALDAMAAEVRFKLCQFDAQELRDSDTARSTALAAAQDILKKMEGYV